MSLAASPLAELEQVVVDANGCELVMEFDVPGEPILVMTLWLGPKRMQLAGFTKVVRVGSIRGALLPVHTVAEALGKVADRFRKATVRPGSSRVKFPRKPAVTAKMGEMLAEAAWHQVKGLPIPTAAEIQALHKQARSDAKAASSAMIAELRTGPEAVARFNDLPCAMKQRVSFRKADFAGQALDGIHFAGSELPDANFTGATLKGALFYESGHTTGLAGADLTGADLSGAHLSYCRANRTVFRDANLSGANLTHTSFRGGVFVGADLSGADLSGTIFTEADLTDARLDAARFTGETRWPKGFTLPPCLIWAGEGDDPRALLLPVDPALRPHDVASLIEGLKAVVDVGKLDKAVKMLRADRFQLFAEVHADHLVGVVRGQSNSDLVYSCRLDSSGGHGCCTQNLNICGGLRGAPCKHILVLVMGLAQAGKLSVEAAHDWVRASRGHKAALDKDAMAETLLRYKGAEAGEIDWRPTETVPEDFFAI